MVLAVALGLAPARTFPSRRGPRSRTSANGSATRSRCRLSAVHPGSAAALVGGVAVGFRTSGRACKAPMVTSAPPHRSRLPGPGRGHTDGPGRRRRARCPPTWPGWPTRARAPTGPCACSAESGRAPGRTGCEPTFRSRRSILELRQPRRGPRRPTHGVARPLIEYDQGPSDLVEHSPSVAGGVRRRAARLPRRSTPSIRTRSAHRLRRVGRGSGDMNLADPEQRFVAMLHLRVLGADFELEGWDEVPSLLAMLPLGWWSSVACWMSTEAAGGRPRGQPAPAGGGARARRTGRRRRPS